jgi:hypothetical protein
MNFASKFRELSALTSSFAASLIPEGDSSSTVTTTPATTLQPQASLKYLAACNLTTAL